MIVKLGKVLVNGNAASSPNETVLDVDVIELSDERYVSRAAYKLASVADKLGISFDEKVVLDVGSSTGGFTDFALQNGAKKVVAVDVGTEQMHPRLRTDRRVELYEKTDIRNFQNNVIFDLVLIDVSFISLKQVLPAIAKMVNVKGPVIAMAKPQFETGTQAKHKGVIKNDKLRRDILKNLENWIQKLFKISKKADSEITGEKGNRERFYLLTPLKK